MASENTGGGKILSRRDALGQHGLRSGMGDWADVKPGETPSELPDIIKPFAAALGLYDEEHDKRVQGLLEAQESFNKGWRTGLQQLGKESVFAPAQPKLGELASLFGGQLPFQPAPSQQVPILPNQTQLGQTRGGQPIMPTSQEARTLEMRSGEFSPLYNPETAITPLQQSLINSTMQPGGPIFPGQPYLPPATVNKQLELAQPNIKEFGGVPYTVYPQGQISPTPGFQPELGAPKPVSDENRVARAKYGTNYLGLTQAQQADVNQTLLDERKTVGRAGAAQVNVNAYTPASEEAQKDFMKSTRATYDQLKSAPVLLQNIEKAKGLITKARGFMGTGGETMLEAAKFLNNRLGMSINTVGIKNAEELRSRIFFNIMDNLKKMDAQPSQLQQQIMQDALGKLGTDPNALAAVLDAYADTIRGKADLFNQEVDSAIQRGVKFPYDPHVRVQKSKGPWDKY